MKNSANLKKTNFDQYAQNYEQLINNQLAFFGATHNYFLEYKVMLSAKGVQTEVAKVLDFGAGIGLSLPFLKRYFPNAEIFATDLSERSLEQIRSNYDSVNVLLDHEIDKFHFDLIFVACVLHHVLADNRPELLIRLSKLLRNGGELHIFEHNPWNPITRRMVSTCPFDQDAELIRKSQMIRLIETLTPLHVRLHGYCLFFPQALSTLSSFEKLLRWLPMGGQYYIFAGN